MKLCGHTMGTPGMDLFRALAFFAEIGCEGIEVRCARDGQIDPESADEAFLDRASEAAGSAGVRFACLTPYYRNFVDPDAREREMEGMRRTIDIAARLGCPLVRAYGGILPPAGLSHAETWERTVSGLREAADYAGERGVGLAIETHGGSLTLTASQAAEMARDLDRANVGILFDYVWVYLAGEETLAEAVDRCAPWIRHAHVKDCVVDRLANRTSPRLYGEGEIDLPGLVQALKATGYEGYLSDEYEKFWHPELPEPEVGMLQDARYLRSLLSRL